MSTDQCCNVQLHINLFSLFFENPDSGVSFKLRRGFRWFPPIFEGTESVVHEISNLPVAFPFKLCFPSNYDVNDMRFEKKRIWSRQFGNTALKRLSVSCSRVALGASRLSQFRDFLKRSMFLSEEKNLTDKFSVTFCVWLNLYVNCKFWKK